MKMQYLITLTFVILNVLISSSDSSPNTMYENIKIMIPMPSTDTEQIITRRELSTAISIYNFNNKYFFLKAR